MIRLRPDWRGGLRSLLAVMAIVAFPAGGLAGDDVPQVVRGGGVVVRVTRLPAEGQALRFRIEMDTHMRDLDGYRFVQIVRVRDAAGKEYPPAAVEGLMGGGHHWMAILRFPAPDPGTTTVELLVRNVAGVQERVFLWKLRGLEAPGRTPPDGVPRNK